MSQRTRLAPSAQQLLDALPAAAVVIDAEGHIAAVNSRWTDFCIANGGRVETVSPPTDYLAVCGPEPARGIREVLRGTTDRYEFEYPCHDDTSERWFRMIVTPLLTGALVAHLDITGEYVRVSRWLETTPTAILELDPTGDATFVNWAWARYMRTSVRELLGTAWSPVLADPERQTLHDAVHASTTDFLDRSVDICLPVDGQTRCLRFQVSPNVDDSGRLRWVSLVGMDVTEARELNNRLAATAERQRIAADIHDIVVQDLFAAGMALNSLHPAASESETVAKVTATIDRAIADLRGIAVTRRVERSQLDEAVQHAALALHYRPELTVEIELTQIDDDIRSELVAVVREALANVARHAQATRCAVTVTQTAGDLVLTVRDNGIGMPADPARRSGTGNITDRATRLGGTARWLAAPGGGTQLVWQVPLARP